MLRNTHLSITAEADSIKWPVAEMLMDNAEQALRRSRIG